MIKQPNVFDDLVTPTGNRPVVFRPMRVNQPTDQPIEDQFRKTQKSTEVAITNTQIAVARASGSAAVGGDIGGTPNVPLVVSTHLAAPLPVAQGGTAVSTVAANLVFAGATSGVGQTPPGFRLLVIADLPFTGTASSTTFARGDGTWVNPIILTVAAPTVAASQIGLGNGTSGTATAGAATLPANPVGFVIINIAGTNYKLPYYNV
jgi:hypothetical protein